MNAPTCTKARYPDKKTALTVVNQRTRGRQQRRHGRPEYLRAYPCDYCRGWHITHHR